MRVKLLRMSPELKVSTMPKSPYSAEFINQALQKVLSRGTRTMADIALELNVNKGTLKGWAQSQRNKLATPSLTVPSTQPAPANFTLEQKLLALQETYGLSPESTNAWCRERGLFASQLAQWRGDFIQGASVTSAKEQALELRELKVAHVKLGADLRRKEKALAEAAALLVLQKKFQALYSDEAP